MINERSKNNNSLDELLDEADQEEDSWTDRIHETLLIDGEAHPKKGDVHRELTRIHGRRKPGTRSSSDTEKTS